MAIDEIRRLLHDGDPLKNEALMPADVAGRMRRVVLSHDTPRRMGAPTFVMALSGALSLVIGAGVWAVRLPPGAGPTPMERSIEAEADVRTSGSEGRRQVLFATPGGTRVIWQLDTTSH